MTGYYRVMLGKKSMYAKECIAGSFIGADFGIRQDLSAHLPDSWRDFNQQFIPVFLQLNPGKSKIAAGLACGALWTVSKGIHIGDIVLCPDGEGRYLVGEVAGDYHYEPDGILPHRRRVNWSTHTIDRAAMSQALRNSTGSVGTVSDVTSYAAEIETLIEGDVVPPIVATDATIEDPGTFAMEKHLQDFLIENWAQCPLGKKFDIYEDENGSGREYQTDDKGRIDILAISKDKKTLLVVELKKGRASDVVVGQTMRYIGYVQEMLAENGQQVRGAIIALEDDIKLRRALIPVASLIDFYLYEITFKLRKV